VSNQNLSQRVAMRQREMRRIERIFIYHRWLYMAAIGLMALVYPELPITVIIVLAGVLGVTNLAVAFLYRRLSTLQAQRALSLAAFAVDGLSLWGLMLLFIDEPVALVYAVFTLIVIEGAVRFSLVGSLLTGAFFVVGLSVAWGYRVLVLGMDFDLSSYVFWVGLIVLEAIMVGMAVREGRKQRFYAEALAAESTRETERRRIASELHDTVLKSLQGLAFEAHAMERSAQDSLKVTEQARYIAGVCREMSEEIRGVALEMRDDADSVHDFAVGLKTIVDGWSRASGISAELSVYGDIPDLPVKRAHNLRRVAGEALSNVANHSGATGVSVRLGVHDGYLKLEVADDGHGFDASGGLDRFVSAGRLGLVSMKERVDAVCGAFAIDSRPEGTTVSASIPLSEGAA